MSQEHRATYELNVTVTTERADFMELFHGILEQLQQDENSNRGTEITSAVTLRNVQARKRRPEPVWSPNEKPVTMDDLRVAMAENISRGNGAAVKAVIARYAEDGTRMMTIPEEHFAEAMNEMNQAGQTAAL